MQITSIELSNIKSHRSGKFTFSSGINVLSGPNGVGKSTIFEAVGYAMFGVDARDFVGKTDRFVSIGAKRGSVTVTFQINNGDKYQVSRTVGTGSKWLLAKEMHDDFEVEEHTSSQETEARLKELLELDNARALSEQFKLVIGPFQNDFLGPFVIKQPTKRQEAFDEILGIDDWRKTFKGTVALLTTVNGKIEVLDTEIKAFMDRISILPDKKKELKTITATLKSKNAELKSRNTELTKFSELVKALDKKKQLLDELLKNTEKTEASIESGQEYISSQEELVKQAAEASKLVKQNLDGKEAFEKAEAQRVALSKKENERRSAENNVSKLESTKQLAAQQYDNLENEIRNTAKEVEEEMKELKESKEKIQPDKTLKALAEKLNHIDEELGKYNAKKSSLEGEHNSLLEGKDRLAEGECPFFKEPCQNISGDIPADIFTAKEQENILKISNLETKITQMNQARLESANAQQKIIEIQGRLAEITKAEKGLKLKLAGNEKKRSDLIKFDKARQEANRKAIEAKLSLEAFSELDQSILATEKEKQKHQKARELYLANINLSNDQSKHELKLSKFNDRMNALKQELQSQQHGLKAAIATYDEKQHQDARNKKDSLLGIVATTSGQITSLEGDQVRLKTEIDDLKAIKTEIDVKTKEKHSLEEKSKLVKFLRNQIFNNVSNQLSERYREEISLRADRIYRTISESDEELYWGDNYQIVLRDLHEGQIRERTDDQLSGGQTMSAVVALRLALLQTIGARIAFFDEPTSNLDEVRRENLANAFRAIDISIEGPTEHWYDQLFLVSHDVAFTEVTDQITVLD